MFPLYFDEDSTSTALAKALRARGIDVLTTLEAGRLRTDDEEQLAFAASQGRAIYTANVAHFNKLHRDWIRAGRHHAGIVLLRTQRTSIGAQLLAFVSLQRARDEATMRDQLEFLGRWA